VLKHLITFLLFFMVSAPHNSEVFAQGLTLEGKPGLDIHPTDVIIWTPVQALSDGKGHLLVALRLETRDQFTIYKDKLEIRGPAGYSVTYKTSPVPRKQQDPMGEGEVDVYYGGDFELELKGDKPINSGTVSLFVTFLGCTHKICLFPFTQELKVPVYLSTEQSMTSEPSLSPDAGAAASVADPAASAAAVPDLSSATLPDPGAPAPVPTLTPSDETGTESRDAMIKGLSLEEEYAEKLKTGALPFGLLLIVVFIGGLATNLTPCVFPMIPITLRLLARDGHKTKQGTILYALGIILTYTALGVVASLSGGVFGSILANKWVNLGFGVIFAVLAVTMLGFGNLSKLQNLGASLGSGRASALNSIGMGAGAGLVAAPCTGPIMGALIASSAHLNNAWQSTLLFFLYSLGFALPYVFIGFAAHSVKSFKVSPKIQVATKMIFAAAMFGLAAYYLKNIAYGNLEAIRGYWQWIAIVFLIAGLIGMLLILRRASLMHHKATQLLPTLMFGLGLFAAVQWSTGSDLASELKWIKSEAEGFAMAQEQNRPIIIDGWADWCVACKEMDKTTFHDPDVISLLKDQWVFVKLDLTEINDANEALAQKYEMPGLPTLVILPADGDLAKARRLTGYVSGERLIQELKSFQGQ